MVNPMMGKGPMGQMGKPQQRINLDNNNTREIVCTYCDNPTFIEVVKLRDIPVLMAPPKGGEVMFKITCCTNCQKELDLVTAKKWAWLTPEERKKAQAQKYADKKGKDNEPPE